MEDKSRSLGTAHFTEATTGNTDEQSTPFIADTVGTSR